MLCRCLAASAGIAMLAGLAAPPLPAAPRRAAKVRAGRAGETVAIEEENLPPEDLPSPGASPSAAASPGTPAAQGNGGSGQAAVNGAASVPGAASSPALQAPPAENDAAGWARVPAPATAGGAAAPAGGAPGTGAPPAGAADNPGVAGEQPSPMATPTDTPPPYDVGSIQPTAPVSEQPLNALIESSKDQPALNASLHVTERARQALAASKLDEAIRDLASAISIDPTDPYAYFYLGRAWMEKKNCDQALAFFSRSEIGLRAVPAWFGEVKSFEGACLEEQGKFPAAALAYKQALDAAPGNLTARAGYGRLSANLSEANAAGVPAPAGPANGGVPPAPQINLAAPPPAEAAPPSAGSAQPGAQPDSGAEGADGAPGGQ
jgi:hypothetical protein